MDHQEPLSMSDLRILALDLATTTGWARNWDWDGKWDEKRSGSHSFALKRGESAGMRWIYFRNWLSELVRGSSLDVIVFEAPLIGPMRSGTAAEIAYGMSTRVQEYAHTWGSEYRPVHNATLKLWLTGKGNAPKERVIECIRDRGFSPRDDHEADAIALLLYAEAGFPDPAGDLRRERERKKAEKAAGRARVTVAPRVGASVAVGSSKGNGAL
jgi:hypothetical protein